MAKYNTVYSNSNMNKKIHRNNVCFIQQINQYQVSRDIREKNKQTKNFIKQDFDNGFYWFESGLSLEDASYDMQINPSFIAGFERGKRLDFINKQAYNTGIEYFLKGILLENIPVNYKNNSFFIKGYNDARDNIAVLVKK